MIPPQPSHIADRGPGGGYNVDSIRFLEIALFLIWTIKPVMENKSSHGGRRPGAGRPLGALNKRTLLSNEAARAIPRCNNPKAFLEALMQCEGVMLKLRVMAAKALLHYSMGGTQ